MRLSALSVDLDSLTHYCRIQGLPDSLLDERARGLLAEKAIPRLLELFAAANAPATFFVIGADVSLPGMKRALSGAHAAGVAQHHAGEVVGGAIVAVEQHVEGMRLAVAVHPDQLVVGYVVHRRPFLRQFSRSRRFRKR